MNAAEIRARFLGYFRERGHEVVHSSPVVPHDDPTLLFANAGMNQFKSVFTGSEKRDYSRAASSQKCIRAGGKHNDLDNVGYTARHLTFFEMLGNFSFGDYFKSDACAWAWDLITNGYGLDPTNLWITVFHEDDEARAVWRDEVGISNDRIVGLGEKDNYWSMGDVGPCGPCSEIHIDRGEDQSCGPKCALGVCDCDRWLEFWNLVFMQFEQRADGTKVPLPHPSIDTGMGLERMTMILQDKETVYETDLLRGIIDRIAEVTGVPYELGPGGTPHRVISDHLRSLAFAIADSAFPSNEGRGYVLRRILRRATRYGYKLGMERPFIHEVVPHLVESMGEAFPELRSQQKNIAKLIRIEEEQFGRTLKLGMARFEEVIAGGQGEFPADQAFFLHDTCGFPIDLTEQMCREKNLAVDRSGFDRLMDDQRERSRQGVTATAESASAGAIALPTLAGTDETRFYGFEDFSGDARIIKVEADGHGGLFVILDATPFYAEGGGQVGDTGVIETGDFRLRVDGTRKKEGVFFHHACVESGDLAAVRERIKIDAHIDVTRRLDIQRNHTATHLMHAALRTVLGTHVQQKGSLVAPDRLRFDVSHFQKVTAEELAEIVAMVHEQILANTEIVTGYHDKDEALARGALAFFGDKYGDRVRVVEIGDFSVELCGGAHCGRTGEIGGFTVVSEGSVSSGVRRVEALTGRGSQERSHQAEHTLDRLMQTLRVSREGVVERVDALLEENRSLKSSVAAASQADLLAALDGGDGTRETIDGVEIVAAAWVNAPQDELLRVSDALKQRPGPRVYILAGSDDDSVKLLVGSSKALKKGRVHCGNVAKAGAKIVGGGGGGRPDLAQAGGKDPVKLDEALEAMRKMVADELGGE